MRILQVDRDVNRAKIFFLYKYLSKTITNALTFQRFPIEETNKQPNKLRPHNQLKFKVFSLNRKHCTATSTCGSSYIECVLTMGKREGEKDALHKRISSFVDE